ncbi:MAG: hypothetical protein ACYSWZ_21725 [Planctomycetota bacterium]
MPIPTARTAHSSTITAHSIPSLDFPFVFINITPSRLHNNTTSGSISTLPVVEPAKRFILIIHTAGIKGYTLSSQTGHVNAEYAG